MRHVLFRFTVLALLTGSLLGPRASVTLAGGSGAQTVSTQIHVNECVDQNGLTFCHWAKGEEQSVSTPTGGFNGQINLQYDCYSAADAATGAPLYSDCLTDVHVQTHTKGTETQVFRTTLGSTFIDDAGNVYCFSSVYHEANGRVQYDSFSTACG